jgi:hypothetical protein
LFQEFTEVKLKSQIQNFICRFLRHPCGRLFFGMLFY